MPRLLASVVHVSRCNAYLDGVNGVHDGVLCDTGEGTGGHVLEKREVWRESLILVLFVGLGGGLDHVGRSWKACAESSGLKRQGVCARASAEGRARAGFDCGHPKTEGRRGGVTAGCSSATVMVGGEEGGEEGEERAWQARWPWG